MKDLHTPYEISSVGSMKNFMEVWKNSMGVMKKLHTYNIEI